MKFGLGDLKQIIGKKLPSLPLAQIAVGGSQYAWGLDLSGSIYHHGTSFGHAHHPVVSHTVHHHVAPQPNGINISLPGVGLNIAVGGTGASVSTGYKTTTTVSTPSYPSTQPTAYPSTSPAAYPSTQPNSYPSTSPGAYPSTTPGAYPSTTPGAYPSTTPGAYPGSPPPSMGYPAPSMGYSAPAPSMGYPAPAPSMGYPAPAPSMGYSSMSPSMGYPAPMGVPNPFPAQVGVQISGPVASYPASKQQVDDVINDTKKVFAKDQVDALGNSLASRVITNLTANDCGLIIKALWKQNQVPAARLLQPLCLDQHGFRAAMEQNMWTGEYKSWINS